MFENWKKKLSDLSSSLQQTQSVNNDTQDLDVDLNFAAGSNLLSKYECDWQVIHENNEENIKNAEKIAVQIEELQKDVKSKYILMNDCLRLYSGTSALLEKIRLSKEAVDDIRTTSAALELRIENLEDLCEECDFQELILQKNCELNQYKQKKIREFEKHRKEIAASHENKIRQHEEHLRNIQRERQAVFDEAFRNDMEEYKAKGSLQKIEKVEAKNLMLEEVILDIDTSDALEDFLKG